MDQSNGVATDDVSSTAGQRAGAPAGEQIRRELLSWPGVTDAPHRFGGVAFHLGRRELGHLHGDSLADFPFPADHGRGSAPHAAGDVCACGSRDGA